MTVDAAGNAVIVGKTYDEHFPATPGVVQTEYSAPVVGQGEGIRAKFDAFVAKLNTSGSAVMWATYFGTSGDDETLESVSTDSTGNLWLSGTTKPYRATEWHPPIECAVWRCGPPGGGPLGSSLIVGLDPSAARVLFSGVFAPGWGKVSRVDSSGLIHASGRPGWCRCSVRRLRSLRASSA